MRVFQFLVLLSFASHAYGSALSLSESVDGDLSGDYLSPTALSFGLGSNMISGSMLGGELDVDLFTFDILPGQILTEVNVLAYSGGGGAGSFIGMQYGTQLSADPLLSNDFPDPIGYAIFGLSNTELMDDLTFLGSPFHPADTLSDASYVVWLNETTAGAAYTLEFVVVPEPKATLIPIVCLIVTLMGRRRCQ